MKTLSSKRLKEAEQVMADFEREVTERSVVYDVPSMLAYCIEKDLRESFRQKKFKDHQIDELLRNSKFSVAAKVAGVNKVRFSVNRKSIYERNEAAVLYSKKRNST